ncbi:hypothetical protein LKD70_03860 [Ruminococcus sp. CLA-AA-H200]|uniref:Uncharacterized protein n=1 Tax=Ruminococcus turbiniformis TaxID=2881258 RepID=A0ABS8FVC6_9FIRM|nr:hypothetical protein [Ruminococcus turbiniformis]MCC2253579.1 hypothetical protein [Ruminococcus turbiniformis]
MVTLESLVDFTEETIAEYATSADTCNKYHCIIPNDSDDISAALEDTLHRLIEAGADDDEIRSIMCAEKIDPQTEDSDEIIQIDLGYCICGQMLMFQKLEQVQEYRSYCMQWYAEHEICLELILHEIDLNECQGLYERIGQISETMIGDRPKDFISYVQSGENRKKIIVKTPHGNIRASQILDNEYPGIELSLVTQGFGEPGAIMEYSPTTECVNLRVYGMENPDGDPIEIFAMSHKKNDTTP